MTFYLVPLNGVHAIATTSPLIKADEQSAFSTAAELLAAVDNLSVNVEARTRAAKEEAYEEGYSKAIAHAQIKLSEAIAELTRRVERQSEERRNDIADAAIAATRAIIGTFDNSDVLRRLIVQALGRVDSREPIVIEVNPSMAGALSQNLELADNIKIASVDDLAPLDCVFRLPKGRVLAGLDLQMSALADRWGLDQHKSESELA